MLHLEILLILGLLVNFQNLFAKKKKNRHIEAGTCGVAGREKQSQYCLDIIVVEFANQPVALGLLVPF